MLTEAAETYTHPHIHIDLYRLSGWHYRFAIDEALVDALRFVVPLHRCELRACMYECGGSASFTALATCLLMPPAMS